MRKIVFLTVLFACLLSSASLAASAQTRKGARQVSSGPESVTRRFYAWYLGWLNKDEWHPLRRRREALKFLDAKFHRRAPGLMIRGDGDIFICAQDWMKEWADKFTVAPAVVRGSKATTVVTLPVKEGERIRIKLMLRRAGGVWKIEGTDCLLDFEEAR
ncbi:MAG TPA: DUF3828 domain-containing protein [Pyrinomonadaceae bacterium]|nr:DUF3828 domain-containing protein [Pyrinomonadaceae bacterium]